MRTIPFLAMLLLTACTQPWTDKERKALIGGCLNKATADMGVEKARRYCQCMQQEVEKRYPDAGDVKYLSKDTAVYSLGRKCRDSVDRKVP